MIPKNAENPQTPVCQGVRAFWLLPVGWMPIRSQTRRDTNFAIPGYSLFCHDTTAEGKIKDFSVCGHSCGQNRFCAAFSNRGKSRKRRRRKALRRFASSCPGYRHGTPKPRALPSELHPVMKKCAWLEAVCSACQAGNKYSRSAAKKQDRRQRAFCFRRESCGDFPAFVL